MEINPRKLKKAFKILRRNYGAPGRDGISIRDIKMNFSDNMAYLKKRLDNEDYLFTPPSFTTFSDFNGKLRKVYVYTVMDRWVQHYLKLELAPLINSLLQPYTFAHIRGRNNIDASKYILQENPPYVLKLDIAEFYQSINNFRLFHLIDKIEFDSYLRHLLIQSFANSSDQGLPLGHVLSPTLSNLYMNDFDLNFPTGYARYSDDLLFVLNSKFDKQNIVNKVIIELEKLDLKLNCKKTKIFRQPKIKDLL